MSGYVVKDYISHLLPGDQFCLVDEDYFANVSPELDAQKFYFIKSYQHTKTPKLIYIGFVAVSPEWPENDAEIPTPYVVECKIDEEVCLTLPVERTERGLALSNVYEEIAEVADMSTMDGFEKLDRFPDDIKAALFGEAVGVILEERLDTLYADLVNGSTKKATAKADELMRKLAESTPMPHEPILDFDITIKAINEDGSEEIVNVEELIRDMLESEEDEIELEFEDSEEEEDESD